MALMVLPVLFVLGVLIAAVPLYLTLKFFSVDPNTYLQALKVTVLGWVLSVGLEITLSLVGLVIPVIPQFLMALAPFAVYVWLLQRFYALNLMASVIVSLVQMLVAAFMIAAMVVGVLLPLGIGAALLGMSGI